MSSVLYLLLLLLEKANGVYAPNLLPLSAVIIVIVKDIPSTLEWKADAWNPWTVALYRRFKLKFLNSEGRISFKKSTLKLIIIINTLEFLMMFLQTSS